MDESGIKKDPNGFPYFEKQPQGTKLGKISDFIEIDSDYENYHKVKEGMKYLLVSSDGSKYYQREVGEGTQAAEMEPFIVAQRLFIFILD